MFRLSRIVIVRVILVVCMAVLAVLEYPATPMIAWIIGAISGAVWGGSTRIVSLLLSSKRKTGDDKQCFGFLVFEIVTGLIIYLAVAGIVTQWPLLAQITVTGLFLASLTSVFSDRRRSLLVIDLLVRVVSSPVVSLVWFSILPARGYEEWTPGLGIGCLFTSIGASYIVDAIVR